MKYNILFTIFLLLVSCSIRNGKKIENPNSNKIILIFEKPKINNRYILKTGKQMTSGTYFEISYIDHFLIKHELPLDYNSVFDTIVINTNLSTIEISLCYKAIDKLTYFFKKGDIIKFTYDGIKPFAFVTNRKTLPFDINYDITIHDKVCKNDFPGTIKHDGFIHFIDFSKGQLEKEREGVMNSALIQFEREYNEETKFLDSLQYNALISKDICHLFKHSLNIKYQTYLKESDDFNVKTLNEQFYLRSDSSMFLDYYRTLFSRRIFTHFESKVDRIITGNSNMPNFMAIFDSISLCSALTKLEKKALLMDMLDLIIKENSKDIIVNYLNKFSDLSKDTVLTNYFIRKYNLNFNDSDVLILKDINGHTFDYKNILNKYKGKVIYVDLWASWCAPCLESIPYSKQLKEEYRNSDVVFLNISIDENFEYWINAIKKHELEENGYLIVNKHVSQFLKDINLIGIPRYLLYDKSGRIVADNAPGPHGAEIRKLLINYINE
jgi:thiol-disulfide isomerase/thioredoxin